MKLHYAGEFDERESYVPGSVVRLPAGNYQVRTYRGDWEPVAAPVDRSCQGPAGRDGRHGIDGKAGRDGIDGADAASFNPRGKWRSGSYQPFDVVTHEGSSYLATATTFAEPPGKGWQLLARRGKRGPAGKEGATYYSSTRRITENVSKVPIGFSESVALGDVVRIAGDNVAAKAIAHGSDAEAIAVGLVSAPGEMQTSGPFTNEAWNLTPGTVYYLSPSVPGELTATQPLATGDYIIIVGTAISPTTLNIRIHWMARVAT